jgi:hypothetical protein
VRDGGLLGRGMSFCLVLFSLFSSSVFGLSMRVQREGGFMILTTFTAAGG